MRGRLEELLAVDPRSLAAFRIGLALVLLADLASRARAIEAHYTRLGVLPADVLRELHQPPLLSLHLLNDSRWFQSLLFATSGLCVVLLLVGWKTRWAALLTLAMTYSLHTRNPLTLQYSDLMIHALLVWAVFLPLDGYASIDAWRDPSRRRARPVLDPASAALVLQGFLVYFVTAVAKLYYPPWQEGRALFASLNKAMWVRPLGRYLLEFPDLLRVLTWGVLAVEILIPVLALSPWSTRRLRSVALALAVALQAGIFLLLDLGLFQAVALVLVMPWLPPAFWDRRTPFRLPASGDDRPAPWLARVTAGGLLALVGLYNLLALWPVPPEPPRPLQRVGQLLRLDQKWRMFDDTDRTLQGWFAVGGRTGDGGVVDLLTGRPAVSLERPAAGAATALAPTAAWAVYWRQLLHPRYAGLRPYAADYFCRRWNRTAVPDRKITHVDIVYVAFRHHDPAVPPTQEVVRLVAKACPPG